jgi:hypothetical protein
MDFLRPKLRAGGGNEPARGPAIEDGGNRKSFFLGEMRHFERAWTATG